jgi:hypothetical protein
MLTVMVKWKEPYSTAEQLDETPFWASNGAFFVIFLSTDFKGKGGMR